MSLVDETIRLDARKQSITILRESGNISSYMVSEVTGIDTGKRRLDPFYDFETFARMPSDSGIVSGDMGQSGNDYYLVMAIESKWLADEIGFYRCTLYKCNSTVSVYYFNNTTKKHDTLHKSNVRCLITQVRAREWDEDKALAVRQYRGRQQPFQLFVQESSGIVSGVDCIVVDQSNRRFRVSKEIDVFIAGGISQAQIIWER